jgi:predicted phage baseplate assembly protein
VLAPPVDTTTAPIAPADLVAALADGSIATIVWQVRDRNGFAGQLTAPWDAVALTQAPAAGEEISEIAFIASTAGAIVSADGRTTIQLQKDLRQCFERESLRINANVAPATHGETVREVLGAGDASQPYQQFLLKQPPLTFVSDANASGARSTLEVRVNDLLWREVESLYGRASRDRVYVTQQLDDGHTVVTFGDGQTGARLPTGRENVRAAYRKGIGLAGLVKAGQLSQLMTAPLGVKGAVNPEAATGGADPEAATDARRNAPLTVLTLGRAVSLQDYEDFARAFTGVAKALATWSWDGLERRVLITISGTNGAEIPEDSRTFINLVDALTNSGDPFVHFTLKSYRPVTFHLVARLKVDEPTYVRSLVHAAVAAALRERFSFDARAFAQSVVLSEVIAVMQRVPGIIAVDVEKLYRDGDAEVLNSRLVAASPHVDATGVLRAAELLVLDPGPMELEVML